MRDKSKSNEKYVIKEKDIDAAEVIVSFFPFDLLRRLYLTMSVFSSKSLINHAASGAFYFILSIVPLALFFVFAIDSWLSEYGKVSDYFFSMLSGINPEINKEFFIDMGLLKGGKSAYGAAGVLGLIWSSRLVFNGIRNAFNVIFQNEGKRSAVFGGLTSFIFLPIIFIVCAVFLGVSAAVKQAEKLIVKFNMTSSLDLEFLDAFTGIYPFLAAVFMVFVIYKFVPPCSIKSIYALIGALLFVVSIDILQNWLAFFMSFGKYHIIYGVISALIIALIWAYILFALFYFFAAFIYVQERYCELEFLKWFSCLSSGGFFGKPLFPNAFNAAGKYGMIFNAGDIIYRDGEQGGFIFVLLAGSVHLYKNNDFIADIAVNSFFGEGGVVGKHIYDTDAVCQVSGFGLKLPADFYNRIIGLSPVVSNSLLQSVVLRRY